MWSVRWKWILWYFGFRIEPSSSQTITHSSAPVVEVVEVTQHPSPTIIQQPVVDSDEIIEREIKKIEKYKVVDMFTWWTDITHKKMEYMVSQKMDYIFASEVIDKCKLSYNPWWCVVLVTHVRTHESGRCKTYTCRQNNNPFWLMQWWQHMKFGSKWLALDRWLESYNKYWYKNNCKTMVTRSLYTMTQKTEWINNCYRTQNNFDSL